MRRRSVFLFLAAVLLLEPFAEHGIGQILRRSEPLPCSCIGSPDAPTQIVYLHGLDTFAPSWMELQNRARLSALATALHARIALPRAPGHWPQGNDRAETEKIVRSAARTCFRRDDFVLLGFSDGANAASELFETCRGEVASRFVAVGPSGGSLSRALQFSPRCGEIVLLSGHHEPDFPTSALFSKQLARRGARARFVDHDGPHQIPLRELIAVFAGWNRRDGR